jgi:hypothetical protein
MILPFFATSATRPGPEALTCKSESIIFSDGWQIPYNEIKRYIKVSSARVIIFIVESCTNYDHLYLKMVTLGKNYIWLCKHELTIPVVTGAAHLKQKHMVVIKWYLFQCH